MSASNPGNLMDSFKHEPLDSVSSEEIARQRNASRDSLLIAARLRRPETPDVRAVRVRNLSAGGLMAEYAEPIAIGAPVEIEVRNIGWVPGRIAWVAEGRIGIAFDVAIDPKLARKPVGKPVDRRWPTAR